MDVLRKLLKSLKNSSYRKYSSSDYGRRPNKKYSSSDYRKKAMVIIITKENIRNFTAADFL